MADSSVLVIHSEGTAHYMEVPPGTESTVIPSFGSLDGIGLFYTCPYCFTHNNQTYDSLGQSLVVRCTSCKEEYTVYEFYEPVSYLSDKLNKLVDGLEKISRLSERSAMIRETQFSLRDRYIVKGLVVLSNNLLWLGIFEILVGVGLVFLEVNIIISILLGLLGAGVIVSSLVLGEQIEKALKQWGFNYISSHTIFNGRSMEDRENMLSLDKLLEYMDKR